MDNGAEEDRERDGSTSSSTIWRTCSSTWRMPRIELNGEREPVWLTPHLSDPQPEGERESSQVNWPGNEMGLFYNTPKNTLGENWVHLFKLFTKMS